MTIEKMDRAAASALRAEIEEAAQAIARRHGLEALVKKCSFDGATTVHFGIEMATIGENGVARTHEAEDFIEMALTDFMERRKFEKRTQKASTETL